MQTETSTLLVIQSKNKAGRSRFGVGFCSFVFGLYKVVEDLSFTDMATKFHAFLLSINLCLTELAEELKIRGKRVGKRKNRNIDNEKNAINSFIAVGYTNVVGAEPRCGGIGRHDAGL